MNQLSDEAGQPPAHEKPSRAKAFPLEHETMLFILVSTLDLFMTYILFHYDFDEANPIAQFFLYSWGIKGLIYFKFFMVAVIVTLTQIIAKKRLGAARGILRFATLVAAGVVVYSLVLMFRHVQLA